MVSHEMAERAYVQSMIELADARHAATIDSLRTDVDRLRDNWDQSYSEQRRASEERIATGVRETQQDLRAIASGDTTPPQDVAAGALGDGSGASLDHGHGPRQQPDHAAELERARAIKDMSLKDWGEIRQTLIRTNDGLFG